MGKTRKKRNHPKGWLVGSNATQIIRVSFVLLIAILAVGLFLIHRRYKALLAKYSSTEPRA